VTKISLKSKLDKHILATVQAKQQVREELQLIDTGCGFSPGVLKSHAEMYIDTNRKTCMKLRESTNRVAFMILDMQRGLILEAMNPVSFHNMYKRLEQSNIDHSAKVYAECSRYVGSTERVLGILGRLTPMTQQEIDMATKRTTERAAVKAGATGTDAAPKKKREITAAGRFQELIMKGTLTDDQIFAAVKKEFGLNDSKRYYVGWYRNYCKRQGKNPPPAKVDPAAKQVKAAKAPKKTTKAPKKATKTTK